MSGKPYFPNNWKLYKDSPDNFFIPHTFEEVMSWKVQNWELPQSVACIIRTHDPVKHKVKEYVYQRPSDAKKKVEELIRTPDISIAIADHEQIHFLIPDDDNTDVQ